MPEIPVTLVLPNGGARRAEMPDDVPVGELVVELTTLLQLPTVGPDGRPMGYRMDSKALGRELTEKETLASANIPSEDRLMITADITAGAEPIDQSPRMRRLRGDYQLIQELMAQSELIKVETVDTRPGIPPERYIVTYLCKSIIDVDRQGNPKFGDRHQVDIYLHSQYPQRWPGMKWLTPIWHPNINHLNGTVCIDAAWWAASRSLDRLVIMIGEMLQYKNFHDDPTKPPFPWDPEAARWCRAYREKHPNVFPLDKRELLRPERVKYVSAPTKPQPAPRQEAKPQVKPPAKPEVKPEAKAVIKPMIKPESKPSARPDPKHEVKITLKKGPNIRLK
jgi:ubiquitin-protein ligase